MKNNSEKYECKVDPGDFMVVDRGVVNDGSLYFNIHNSGIEPTCVNLSKDQVGELVEELQEMIGTVEIPTKQHKLIEFDWLITNGMPSHDASIISRINKGWKIVASIPAKLIHPHACEHDMATIFSKYTPYPKNDELPETPPIAVEPRLVEYDIDEVLEASVLDYETIVCKECGEEKKVEKDTWALENDMCEQCWCEYNGG